MATVASIPFAPLRLLRNPHLQTFLGTFGLEQGEGLHFNPHFIPTAHGDLLFCDEARPQGWVSSHPTVAMIHGLAGSSNSQYILRMSRLLLAEGYRVLRINMRAAGSGMTLAHRIYHGGLTDDIWRVITYIHSHAPLSPLFLIGYSLGGNIALKLAGEYGSQLTRYLRAVVAICPPFDLGATIQKLSSRKGKVYEAYFATTMRQLYAQWASHHGFPLPKLPKKGDMRSFDDHHTAPMWNFKDSHDYYRQASCAPYLSSIALPCHIISTRDDPIVDNHTLDQVHLPHNVNVWVSPFGGHLGFFEFPFSQQKGRWIDHFLLYLLKKQME